MRVRPAPRRRQGRWRERAARPAAAAVRPHDSQVCAGPGHECEHPGGHDAEEQEAGTNPVALVDRLRRGDRDGAPSAEHGGRQQRMAPDGWQDGTAGPAEQPPCWLARWSQPPSRARRDLEQITEPVGRRRHCSIRAASAAGPASLAARCSAAPARRSLAAHATAAAPKTASRPTWTPVLESQAALFAPRATAAHRPPSWRPLPSGRSRRRAGGRQGELPVPRPNGSRSPGAARSAPRSAGCRTGRRNSGLVGVIEPGRVAITGGVAADEGDGLEERRRQQRSADRAAGKPVTGIGL